MMKSVILMSAFLAIAFAKPSGAFVAAPAPIATASSSQYHHRINNGLAAYVAPASPYVAAPAAASYVTGPYFAASAPSVAVSAPYVAASAPYVAASASYVAASAPYVPAPVVVAA